MKSMAWMVVLLIVGTTLHAADTTGTAVRTEAPPAAGQGGGSDIASLLSLGQDRLTDGRWQEAAAAYERAFKQDPANSEAMFGMATAYMQLERFSEALPLMEKLYKTAPDSPSVKNNLAWIYAKAKDPAIRNPEKAVRLSREAVLVAPADVNFWSTLAEGYFGCKKYDRALRAARNALQLSTLAGVTNDAPLRELVAKCEGAAGATKGE
jgi:Flp pilus assembly protein TadD